MRVRNKEIRKVRVADIEDNPANYRRHDAQQTRVLAGTIDEIGYYGYPDVYVTDGGTLRLVDGELRRHHLVKAYGDGAEIEVNVTDFDAREADIALATRDPISAMAQQDDKSLASLLDGLETGNEDLSKFLASMDGTTPEVEEDEGPQIDRAAELQKEWGTKTGQLWIVEGKQSHRVLCGDSTKGEDVGRVMGGEVPLLMVTDPPYGGGHDTEYRENSHANFAPQSAKGIAWDGQCEWGESWELFTGSVAYVWHASSFTSETKDSLESSGLIIRQQVIWKKPFGVMSRCDYHFEHEPCWYAVRKGKVAKWIGGKKETTVWEATIPNHPMAVDDDVRSKHPTQKPLECMARPIRNHDTKNVYDPFLGSGTTLIAAEQLNRRCYGIEISPDYVAVTLQRATDFGMTCKLDAGKARNNGKTKTTPKKGRRQKAARRQT